MRRSRGERDASEDHPADPEHEAARRDDEAAIHLALFRYAVMAPIVELAERRPGDATALVREIAGRPHFMPGRGQIRVAERTIYEWLRVYREHGLEGLRPLLRKDRGASRGSRTRRSRARSSSARRGRRASPPRSSDILKREGGLIGKPEFHRATLDRRLARRGASRRALKTLGERTTSA